MYEIVIKGNSNQTIVQRADIISSHPGEELVAVIDNSPEFVKDEWRDFEFPLFAEGFNRIEFAENNSRIAELMEEAGRREDFCHNDKLHGTETLRAHNERIEKALEGNAYISKEMVLLHDFGKPTAAFVNPGERYISCYGHCGIGTRELISYMATSDIKKYYCHIIICSYHRVFLSYRSVLNNTPIIFEMLKKENLFNLLQVFARADRLKPQNNN